MKRPFKFTWAIWFLLAIHAVVVLAGFVAPYSYETQERQHPYAPPTALHFVDCQGKFHFRPFVYVTKSAESSPNEYTQDCAQPAGIEFFTRETDTPFWGCFIPRGICSACRRPPTCF